ncbi:MAG: DUF3418 domain-containing protein, partial [Thiotrichaceae bacterium]|nr:DUF3418 domain-containing protein [Thiotrichaceae bacterium]
FYQQRIEQSQPSGFIYTRAAFEQWRKNIEKKEAQYLYLEQDDLLKKDADHISDDLYPASIQNGQLQLPLEYHFLPGHALDGVTVAFPLAIINQLEEAIFDWLVPGLIREKVTLLLRSLPKPIRKQLVPIPDTVTLFLEQKQYRKGILIEQLLDFLHSKLSYSSFNELETHIKQTHRFDNDVDIPDHLKMNFKIIDKEGHEVDSSRNLLQLKQQWGDQALEQINETIDESIEREGLMNWDFDSLEQKMTVERHGMSMVLYPALQDNQKSVSIKLYDQKKVADEQHGRGIYRLLVLLLSKELMTLKKNLPNIDKVCLLYTSYGSCHDLKQDFMNGIVLNALHESLTDSIDLIRDQTQFKALLSAVKARLHNNSIEVSQSVINALQANHDLAKQLKGNIPFNLVTTLADIKSQQMYLIRKGFIARTPLIWLKRLPRYFKGMSARLEKAKNDYRRDRLNQAQISSLWERYEQKKSDEEDLFQTPLTEYRWLIEELRISIFAQELKTAQPVSVKRLEKKWQALVRTE